MKKFTQDMKIFKEKKRMKRRFAKIIIMIFAILILVSALSLYVCAEGDIDGSDPTLSTVYERAIEWWDTYQEEITSIISLGVTAIIGYFVSKIKSWIKDLIRKNGVLENATASSSNKVGELIVGYNGQTDEIRALRVENSELRKINEQNAREITAVKHEIAHIAQILTTVYTNSKALPQGVRDMVNIECAKCMRLASDMKKDTEVAKDDVVEENAG